MLVTPAAEQPSRRAQAWLTFNVGQNMTAPSKKLNGEQQQKLSELLYWAFLEIRNLGAFGKAQQAADLADAFHNLPTGMWRDDFSLEIFRDTYLTPYQKKYPEARPKDYVLTVDQIIKVSE